MTHDLTPIHPELLEIWKKFPKFTFNVWTVRLITLLTKLMPKTETPADILIDEVFIPSRDGKHNIGVRVYKPKGGNLASPVLVWIHGGGYIVGNAEQDDAYVIELLKELRITVVSVDYRLAPKYPFPIPLHDCYDALAWVDANAQTLGIDRTRIAVGGGSAGGGLAANLVQLAQDTGEIQVAFQLLVYPMLDNKSTLRKDLLFPDLLSWNQKSNRYGWESYLQQPVDSENLPQYSVARLRDDFTGFPPTWIGVGTLDLFHDECIAYAQKLKDSDVDCEVEIVAQAFHGFDVFDDSMPVVRNFRKSQIDALRKYLIR